ncbi:signal peptidase II [Cohnella soli]|uniref:Signal peptidase II n=1 Tax=Cohnella soli TaxID=425005 RepID=A0ABW0HWF8_9BACL
MNKRMTWILTLVLIAIEQGIKMIINSKFLDKSVSIIPPFLYFDPMFNKDYSWFNSMLQLGVGKSLHIALVVVVISLLYLMYRFINKSITIEANLIHVMFSFIFAGATCSLIDKVLWDGSLDYILLHGLFTFDLKDVYINIFIGLFIIGVYSKNEDFKKIKDQNILENLSKYMLGKLP